MTRWRARELVLAVALVICAAAAGVGVPRLIPFFATAEQWLIDLRMTRLSTPEPQHAGIVIIAVTEDTLAQLPYRSPVDRVFLANLLRWLDEAGAAAIGIDILFDQPTEPEKDATLRDVLDSMRTPVVLAFADEDDGLMERQTQFLADYIAGLRRGYVTLLTDPYDGIPRWIYPGRSHNGEQIAGFPAAVVAATGRRSTLLFNPQSTAAPLSLAWRQPPAAGISPFRNFPAHTAALLPKDWLAGRIVLIGADLPHIDTHRTPMTTVLGNTKGSVSGIEIHAHAVAQLLDGRTALSITPGTEWPSVTIACLGALAIGAMNIAASVQIALGVAFFAGMWIAGFALFPLAGVMIPLISPSLAFVFAVAGGNAYWRGRTRRQSRFIQAAFSRFTSPAVVRELIRDPDRLRLGGEKREITCLFTDIAGFTSWIEKSEPEQALETLNSYLDGMCRIAFEHDGTINKIIGDALFVFFGAPVAQADHARRAVTCALDLDVFARGYAQAQRAQGIPFGDTRIGVHSGTAVVGNFGGDRFFDYTAYGDTVNTTARLEGANKHVGTLVCVSEAAARRCTDIRFRPIGAIVVAGRSEPVETFEPLPSDLPQTERHQKYLEAFARMREHDPSAGSVFEALAKADPEDALVRFHARRMASGERGIVLRLAGK